MKNIHSRACHFLQKIRWMLWIGMVSGVLFFATGIKSGQTQSCGGQACGVQPFDACIMLDRTGSLDASERATERDAAKILVTNLLTTPGSRVAMGAFRGNSGFPNYSAQIYASLSSNAASINTTIDTVMGSSASGSNLKSAIQVCQNELLSSNPSATKVLILLSDGDANEPSGGFFFTSNATDRAAAITQAGLAKGQGIRIISINYGANGTGNDITYRNTMASISSNGVNNFASAGAAGQTERDLENGVTDSPSGSGNFDRDDYFIAPTTGNELGLVISIISTDLQCPQDPNVCINTFCNNGICQCDAQDDCKACTPGTVATDCDDQNPCTDKQCVNSKCQYSNNSAACDDGDGCTLNDVCSGGACQSGTSKACDDSVSCTLDTCTSPGGTCDFNHGACDCLVDSDCDDGNVCTTETCDTNTFQCVRSNNSVACDDGVFCDGADTCGSGTCSVHAGDPCSGGSECADNCDEAANDCFDPTGAGCTDDGNVCTDNQCDGLGACIPVPNNVSCDDGDACTLIDVCSGGVCNSGAPKDCSDGIVCTLDTCDSANGQCTNDTNACECVQDADCDDQNECTTESCDPNTLQCIRSNNSLSCDDGLFCNGDDTCGGGDCSNHSGDPCANGSECSDFCDENTNDCFNPAGTTCTDDGNVCTDNQCNGSGSCVPINNTASCDDSDECTLNDFCSGGACNPGAPKDCSDGIGCTLDSCDSANGQCSNNTAACECVTDADCDDQNECTTESCDPNTLTCFRSNNSNSCDDGLFCNGVDTCGNGSCSVHVGDPCANGGECANSCNEGAQNCFDPAGTSCTDDGNICTDNQCNGAGACVTSNNSANCDDNDACTLIDLCVGGTCDPGSAVNCDDNISCTLDSCQPATGQCTNDVGACECAQDSDCDDQNGCTTESCDLNTLQCVRSNNSNACDDSFFCNGSDTCGGGSCSLHLGDPCAGGTECDDSCDEAADNCFDPVGTTCTDDGNVCTDNQCDGSGTCAPINNTAICNDGDACTTNDVCQVGTCTGGVPLSCGDSNACTNDSCDSNTGCVNAPIQGCQSCETDQDCTGDACNIASCNDGKCFFTPPNCDDGDLCTVDSCNAQSGCQHVAKVCSDGNSCTDDSCDSGTGICKHVATAACSIISNCPDGDSDADGTCNGEDNCPDTANPDQADVNGNGVGDACEDSKSSSGNDGGGSTTGGGNSMFFEGSGCALQVAGHSSGETAPLGFAMMALALGLPYIMMRGRKR